MERFITPAARSRAWIRTYPCGVHATPLTPTTGMLRVEDIAHQLAHECRFNGAVREFYSVAEHCVRVSWLVPTPFALEALLHDASEAYLKDIPSPLKHQDEFGQYRTIEGRLEACIAARFGVNWPNSPAVKHFDGVLCATEQRDLTLSPADPTWRPSAEPWANGTVLPWSAEDARAVWLRRFADLWVEHAFEPLGYCRSCYGVLRLTPEGRRPLIGGYWRHICGDCGGDFGHQLVRADAPAGWQP